MRILHTADWHLGRALHGCSFLEEQEHLLTQQFLPIVKEVRPDVVVIAGDIYDRAVPPRDAVELLGDILERVVLGLRTPMVLIAGNHDDDRRLGFASPLLREAGLFIGASALGEVFPFSDRHGPVSIVAAGYASPALVATLLGTGEEITDHDAAFAAMAPGLRALVRPRSRSVLLAHAFVQGGETSESERLLQVGGTGAVSAARFAGFDYVALGHLHRRQSMAGGRIAYSGSPLAYSFSEAGGTKSVSLVELHPDGTVTSEALTLEPRQRLRTIRGSLAEVLAAAEGPGREDWLQVILTDRPLGAYASLRERYPSVLDLRYESSGQPAAAGTRARDPGADPLTAFEAFWRAIGEGALSAEERALAIEAIAAARPGEE